MPLTGSIDDAWQTAIEDVGPAGADEGKGGKYLILPPDGKDPGPDGYITRRGETYAGFVILRSNVMSAGDADVAKAVAYGKRVKALPDQAAKPPETVFVDAFDVMYDYSMADFSAKHRGQGHVRRHVQPVPAATGST